MVPSAVAPGKTQPAGPMIEIDPALPRSVLCLLGIINISTNLLSGLGH
jgi:hypothetical protein